MDSMKLRAWWSHRQGLDGTLAGATARDVLDRAGWARSVGGVGPYLTLFSRAGVTRAQADEAVSSLEIHELPSARGCTYVLPASDFALGLKVGQGFDGEMNVARKLGVTDKEVDALCEAVLKALAKGPLEPDELREAAGRAVRSLGEAGKKKGLNSTMPLATGRLQETGQIRRISTNGRLDQQRYRYAMWKPNPLASLKLSTDQAYVELARRYFRWAGPATIAEFQGFSALGVKAAKAAIEPLGLVPWNGDSGKLGFAGDLAEFEQFKPPAKPQYALVSSVDSLFLLRRDLASLIDPKDAKQKSMGEKGLRDVGNLVDLPSHAILDRGRLIGLWEYDPETGSIAWSSFGPADNALKEEVERTEAFVRDELGDARSFSLDSPKSRAPRIAALRKASR